MHDALRVAHLNAPQQLPNVRLDLHIHSTGQVEALSRFKHVHDCVYMTPGICWIEQNLEQDSHLDFPSRRLGRRKCVESTVHQLLPHTWTARLNRLRSRRPQPPRHT